MKNLFLSTLIIFTALASNAQSSTDVSSAEVKFVFVNNDVEGTLTGFNSSSSIDLENLENSKFKGSVKAETISTGNSIRNWSLRRSKYFDADTYPKITFESTSIKSEGNTYEVKGNLTIKDVTREITFKFSKDGKNLTGKSTIYSSDYGIEIKNKREQNRVDITITLKVT